MSFHSLHMPLVISTLVHGTFGHGSWEGTFLIDLLSKAEKDCQRGLLTVTYSICIILSSVEHTDAKLLNPGQ